MNGKYNRIITVFLLCATTIALAYLKVPAETISNFLEKLIIPAGIYVGVKGKGGGV